MEEEKYEILSDKRRSVSFDRIDILEFKQCVGDNPCVSYGPPLALAPDLERRTSLKLDIYECTRMPRRTMLGLSIPSQYREKILLKNGENIEEIEKATDQANAVKYNREQSFHSMEWDKVNEMWEGTTRHFMRKLGLRSSAKKLFHEVNQKSDFTGEKRSVRAPPLLLRSRRVQHSSTAA